MNIRGILFLVVALVSASAAIYVARNWLASERAAIEALIPAPAPAPEFLEVLVATDDMPAGLIVREDHLRWQPWPVDDVPETYIVRQGEGEAKGQDPRKDLGGAVVRTGITGGEPVTHARVVRPGERGFLAAVLNTGMRAVSVQVNATSGISGFVFPGDRVDVILSHVIREEQENAEADAQAEARRVAETVLTDIRVLAVDQTTNDQEGEPLVAKNATLEVTDKQAEVLAVAAELGKLSLSLRSIARPELAGGGPPPPERTRRYTWDSEASRVLHRKGPAQKVTLLRGSSAGDVETGAK